MDRTDTKVSHSHRGPLCGFKGPEPKAAALGSHRQVDLCEFKVSPVYKASSRPVKATK